MEQKLKKLLSLCLALLLFAGLLPAAAWAAPSVRTDAAEPASAADAEHGMGLLPSEGELRFAWELEPQRRALLRAAPLPERYGFTENGDGTLTVWNQTVPKFQSNDSTCVYFSGAGAVESYLLLHGAEGGGDKAALLSALAPYLQPERRARLQKALRLAGVLRIAGAALREEGGAGLV